MRFSPILKIPLIAILLAIFGECSSAENDGSSLEPAISAVERCRRQFPTMDKMSTFEGMVGIGWDNLRNVPMANVLKSTFNQCRTSPDRLYLIPDNLEVISIKQSQLDRTANFYEHYSDYFKSKAETINLEAGFSFGHLGISGSFSAQHQETKKKFFEEKSSLFQTSVLYHAYNLISQPGAELHPTFRMRLLEINDAVSKNLTRMANYLAQITIRDFGTHIITQADVGAVISQEDFVDSKIDFSQTSSLDEFKAAASASLFGALKFASGSAGITIKQTTKEQFSSALRQSQIRTRGGPDVNRLLSATAGENSSQAALLVDDLVALDRSGVPLFTLITHDTLPDLSYANVQQIRYFVKNATEEYYLRNTQRGCMVPGAANFDFQANVNDSSCNQPYNNHTFGGIFQTCEPLPETNTQYVSSAGWRCDNTIVQVNGATGAFSCPEHYEPVNVFTIIHQFTDRSERTCERRCHSCWAVAKCCKDVCFDVIHQDRVKLKAYWCSAKAAEQIPADQGYMFGGLFAKGQANPFTGGSGCPGHFQAHHLGWDLTVCLSRDYQLDGPYSIKFGGFFSCQTPSDQAKCPVGYSQHLATVVDSCEVYYCVRPEAFNNYQSPIAVRPPYGDLSALISNETSSVIYAYVDGKLWFKRPVQDALEEMASIQSISPLKFTSLSVSQPATLSEEEALHQWVENLPIPANVEELESTSTRSQPIAYKSSSQLGTLPIIAIVIGSIVVIAIIVVLGGITFKKCRKREGYLEV